MSLSDLRKELKDLRKKAMPVPVSRMKKETVMAELDRLRGKEEVAVKAVMKEEKVAKPVVKKVEAVQKKAHKEQDEVVKKTKGVKERGMEEPPKKKVKLAEEKPKAEKPKADKPSKGSEEMRERMAKLRAMRKAKADPEEE
jgi:hypothetical protein